MRYLTLSEVLYLHERVLAQSGGLEGVRDLSRVEAAVAQPKATFDGQELHATVIEKAAALCFSLVQGHAFVDGNKRIGHAAMEVFLLLNDVHLDAEVDDQERVILAVASSTMSRAQLAEWLDAHTTPRSPGPRA